MEESRATAAQTLDVVYGLVRNMEVVMDGQYSVFPVRIDELGMLSDTPVRWQDINRRDSTCLGCVCLTYWSAYDLSDRSLVVMQELAVRINKMERSYYTSLHPLGSEAHSILQETSYNGDSDVGCLLQIHPQTITSLARPIMEEQPLGLLKAKHFKSG